jgi:predicted CXXCH cytochrome family protein
VRAVRLLAMAVLLAPAAAWGQSPYEEVAETSHNFLAGATLTEVCASCHLAPEGSTGEEDRLLAAPMWGGGKDLGGTFALERADPDGTYGTIPDTSGACLECHDGVLATAVHRLDNLVTEERGGRRAPNHPIRIAYPRAPNGTFLVATPLPQNSQYWSIPDIRGGELTLPTGPVSSYQPLAAGDAEAITFSVVRSRDGQVHCESCHNPHSDKVPPFLRDMPPNLCLVCHDK